MNHSGGLFFLVSPGSQISGRLLSDLQKRTLCRPGENCRGTLKRLRMLGKQAILDAAIPIVPAKDQPGNWNKLLKAIGNAQVVMIGEASHGTHEFYQLRTELTKRLIAEQGFSAVCVEADWPDAYRVNRFVQQGRNCTDQTPHESLRDFVRFPLWMWRNVVVEEFIGWLREYNDSQKEPHDKAAFYGMDLYSLFSSMDQVISYLRKVSPADAKKAAKNYGLFDRFQGNTAQYGFWAGLGAQSLEKEVVAILNDFRTKKEEYLRLGRSIDGDELFFATRNAALVANAEEYYRKMYHADAITWNIRDSHMAETVRALLEFHGERKQGVTPRVVLWAHNSHLGDARASDRKSAMGEHNVGQLLRQQLGKDKVFNVGFGTSLGSVTASRKWEEPGYLFTLAPGIKGSYERLFHNIAEKSPMKNFMLVFRNNNKDDMEAEELVSDDVINFLSRKARYERYIGVIYRPQTQRLSHCSMVKLPQEYDAFIYLDKTSALVPLDNVDLWKRGPPS